MERLRQLVATTARFSLVWAVLGALPFGTGCHKLRPLGSIKAPCFVVCVDYAAARRAPSHAAAAVSRSGSVSATRPQRSTLQPAPTNERLSLNAGTCVSCFSWRWRVHTAGARRAGRPGSLRPSSRLASRPGQARCPGRCRGIAACPGRGPRGRWRRSWRRVPTVDVGPRRAVPPSSLPAGALLIVERGFVVLRMAPPRLNRSIIGEVESERRWFGVVAGSA
jgi:hypothetical protein